MSSAVAVAMPFGSPRPGAGGTAQAMCSAVRPLGSVAPASAGAASSRAVTAAASQRFAASNRADFEGFLAGFMEESYHDRQNQNAGPENRAGVAALGDPLLVTDCRPYS